MRHGKSVGNEQGIIQGLCNFSISDQGIVDLENSDFSKLSNVKKIYSSSLNRAIETAEIVRKKIGYNDKIIVDNRLDEVSLGILNGKSTEFCKNNYSKAYQIFKQRGDYDEIAGADSWIYTQARVIAFLDKYLYSENENDLLVTHASYIRTFVNLILGRYRNTQFNIDNGFLFHYDNPLKNIEIYNYDIAKASVVKRVKCYDNTYIMKKKYSILDQSDYHEKIILEYLNNYFETPLNIYMYGNDEYKIKISKYLEGIHKYGELTHKEIVSLIKSTRFLNNCLANYSKGSFTKNNIIEELKKSLDVLIDDYTKDKALILLRDEKFNNYINNGEYNLVHNDLHRSNILFDNGMVHILDYESVQMYPDLLQLSTLICSSFLLETYIDSFDIFLNNWNCKLDLDLINKLIDYRLLFGLSFFDDKISNHDFDNSDIEIKKKYMKALGGRR